MRIEAMKYCCCLDLKAFLSFLLITQQCLNDASQFCNEPPNLRKNGDFIIAGLFPVHLYNAAVKNYELNTQAVVWVEAMIFTIDQINKSRKMLVNFTVGYSIHDTCNEIETAIKEVLGLMMGRDHSDSSMNASINNSFEALTIEEESNKNANSIPINCICKENPRPFVSLIGGASSKISASISNILNVDLIPQVSYSSTSTQLSNKELYQSFLRTVPPDNFQSQFIIDILKHYNWRYINVLASDDEYGRIGIDHLLPNLQSEGFCVGVLALCSAARASESIGKALEELANEKLATVTVLWSGKQLARTVINMAAKRRLHNITWIATEAWGGDEELLDSDPRVVTGLLGIQPSMKLYQPFENYIIGKKLRDLTAFKQLHEYIGSANSSSNTHMKTVVYNEDYLFTNQSSEFRNKISNIVEAVYAVGLGLETTLNNSISRVIDFQTLLNSIKNIDVEIDNGIKIGFDDNGDPTSASYMLLNLKSSSSRKLSFEIIANWNSKARRIELTGSSIIYARNSTRVPVSKCGSQCEPGFYAFRETNKKCCWKCVSCSKDTFKNQTGTDPCTQCPMKSISNSNHTRCIELDEIYLHEGSVYGIILIATSIIEVVTCTLIMATFLLFRNTAIVRSSNTQLSLLQLGTAVLAGMHPFFYIGKPTLAICYLRPLVFGLLFTILNSIVFNKADRLLRIFKMRRKVTSDDLLLSNKFQFLVVAFLAFLSVLICVISYTVFQPEVIEEVSRQHRSITIRCKNISVTTNLMVAYINAIGLACIIYTFRSRNLPRQYRERRYIGLAMFVATVAWVVYLLVHFGTALHHVIDFALCLTAQISNGVMLMVIYCHKTWNMLVHPEKNNQVNVHHGNRIAAGPSKVFNAAFGSSKHPQTNSQPNIQEENRKTTKNFMTVELQSRN